MLMQIDLCPGEANVTFSTLSDGNRRVSSWV